MIELIKEKIWTCLQQKEVSLAMIFNLQGEILWHRGRMIRGNTIIDGWGFPKSYIFQVLKTGQIVEEDFVVVDSEEGKLSNSAMELLIKTVFIKPLSSGYYLYIDSGAKESFSATDREIFRILGDLLKEMILSIKQIENGVRGLTGQSHIIQTIREQVLKYALEDQPVLLLGETGAGKSHVAELIHHYSGRKGKFVTIHTPSIPGSLFESEIFGYKKGAFTDAKSDKKGMVAEAEDGTLFFDEISEIPLNFQAKLLRFIENKKYMVLGEPTERTSSARIVAATNKNVQEVITKNELRQDLYYRLHILEIEIPPIRKRKEDIIALVKEKQGLLKGKTVTEDFWATVCEYEWPGNIRELITVLIRAGIHCETPISGKDINIIIQQNRLKPHPEPHINKMDQIYTQITEGRNFWELVWKPFIKKDLNREQVKEILHRFYVECAHNFKTMTEKLNVKPSEYAKFIASIHKYHVHPEGH